MTQPHDITVSLEWAKKLKEAGWPQGGTEFFWMTDSIGVVDLIWDKDHKGNWNDFFFAAPTAEEILRRLPDYLGTEYVLVTVRDHPENEWAVNYIAISEGGVEYHPDHRNRVRPIQADTLANAAAAMYCYLADHKLLP